MNNELKELQNLLYDMLVNFDEITTSNHLRFFLVGGTALGAVRHDGFIPWDDDIDIAMMREDFEKMEQVMKKHDNHWGRYYYSPVENHLIPEAPLGFLCDIIEVDGKKVVNAKIDIHPIDNVPVGKMSRKIQKFFSTVYYFSIYRQPVKNKGECIRNISRVILTVTPQFVFSLCMKISKRIITKWNKRPSAEICSLFGVAGYQREIMPRTYLEPLQMKKFGSNSFYVPGDTHQYLQRLYGDYMKLPPIEEQKPQIHYNGYRSQGV